MINHQQQKGVGLIEVLISILLLSVAVLGFATLQMTSVKATDESLKRTQAMSLARGLAENLRLNPVSIKKVEEVINDPSTEASISITSCTSQTDACTSEELAVRDALTVVENSKDYGIAMGMEVCADTTTATTGIANSSVACIVVAWNTTNPFTDISSRATLGADFVNCANDKGVYYPDADCLIVEAY